jgi:drug/metabolite transporter (DMT)-like permease
MTVRTAIVLAILATACFQVGIVLQKVGADRLPRLGLSIRQGSVYLAFIRSPIWLAGIAINTFGWVLVLKAIANAPVSIIQPVLGFGLALLALFSAVFLKERLSRLESGGLVLMVAGLVLLGVSAAHQDGGGAVSLAPLLAVSVVFAGGIGAALPLGRSGQVPLPVVLGFGAGILIGLGALYTKGLFLTLDAGFPLLAWLVFLPLMMAANICGLWVMQAGFQHGRALIVGAVSAVTTKVVAIVGGMTTLGEVLPDHRVFAVARVAGLVLILLGTVVWRASAESRSPHDSERLARTASGSRLHEGRECVGPIRMPARERRSVLDDVVRRPLDPTLVDRARGLVVRAQDVEVAGREVLEHEIDDLVGGPCRRRLVASLRGHASERVPRHQEVRRHATAVAVPEVVRQPLGVDLHPRLRDVVGGVAGRRRDPLLRAGVDDHGGRAPGNHRGREGLRAVDDAPQIHLEEPPPPFAVLERATAGADGSVVHQDGDVAEITLHDCVQPLDVVEPGDVGRDGAHRGRAGGRAAGDVGRGTPERVPLEVSEADAETHLGKPACRGQADAAGRAGHHGGPSGRQRGVLVHGRSSRGAVRS